MNHEHKTNIESRIPGSHVYTLKNICVFALMFDFPTTSRKFIERAPGYLGYLKKNWFGALELYSLFILTLIFNS